MLNYFIKRLAIVNSGCIAVAIGLSQLFFADTTYAQSLGDPIVNITFGSGVNKYAGPLPADSGSTSYTYSNTSPNDNFYSIVNTTANTNPGWWTTTDHTGNPGGYMMLVNASVTPDIFYTRTVNGLCGSTTYQFAAWIKNILISLTGIKPNVTFSIETPGGTVLGTGNTGDIIANNTWIQYPFTFTTPAGTSAIVLKIANNAPGGGGNDLVIDDITFRPYGDPVAVVFNNTTTTQTLCAGISQTVNINATSSLAAGYQQKLQMQVAGVWTDQGAPGTGSSFAIASPIAAGVYHYRVVTGLAGNISTSECVVSSNELILTVLPAPTAAIMVADSTCLGSPTAFKDMSAANGDVLKTWLWDFGDGQTSTLQNPSHQYASAGNYTVHLTVTNNNTCVTPVMATKLIHITALPVAAFSYSTPDCVTRAVTLTDQSVPTDAPITSWAWDYGDGVTEVKTDNTPFQHTYALTGSYPVKLVVKTYEGCTATKTQTVVVSPLPVVDFIMPPVCVSDNFAAFTDNTTIADNSNAGFTYLWNFGDANATPGNPNTSPLKNPQHKYIQAAYYQVSLTVTSNNGCTVTTTKTFTVNGATPVANFNVLNPAELCSNREVFFVNKSTIGFGNITKIDWYYDYDNNPTVVETDNNPYPDKLYRHTYPEFHSGIQPYHVRMVAYSGGVCFSSPKDINITLLPTPTLTFTPPTEICQNAGTIPLNAQEGSGIAGSGVYSGTGVSAAGVFDPSAAGTGTFKITYIYTATNACADTLSGNITVKPSPTVDAGANITILEGGNGTLHAKATGDGLTYAWSPATGLSDATIADPVVAISNDITYKITVTNAEGCMAYDNVKVSVLKLPAIPTAFTPNGDGINDTWDIKYLNSYADCTVEIFNRYGQRVYRSVGYTTAWDGRMNNTDLPVGVYYYLIDPKHGRKALSGWVSIIR